MKRKLIMLAGVLMIGAGAVGAYATANDIGTSEKEIIQHHREGRHHKNTSHHKNGHEHGNHHRDVIK